MQHVEPGTVVDLTGRLESSRQAANAADARADRLIEAEEASQEIAEAEELDMETVDNRAHAIAGALSTLDFIPLTGREFWAVFGKKPARSIYLAWATKAHALLADIINAHAENLDR